MKQQDDNHIDKPDDFSRKVGEKLHEHRMPVRSGVWETLSGKLPPGKKRIVAYWPWVAAGVAAVALVLLLVSIPKNDDHAAEMAQHEEAFKPEATPEKSDIKKEDEPDIKQIGEEDATEISEKAIKPKRNGNLAQIAVTEEPSDLDRRQKPKEAAMPEEIVIAEKTTDSDEVVQPATEILETVVQHDGMLQTEEMIVNAPDTSILKIRGELQPEELLVENIPVKKKGILQSLAGALGSGGSLPDLSFSGLDADNPQYHESLPGGSISDGSSWGSGGGYLLLSPSDYTDIQHRLPVTISLTADFRIAQALSMETGLSYTYLFSRFSRNDQFIYRGTLQQHYIGIPLNLRYTIWQNDTWNIYLMGGGSVEKGIRAIYKQEVEQNGAVVFHTNVYSRIKGLQFSAQAGAGFSYRLNSNLFLFGEPRFIYYFKNNQPMSARTENPLIFGLNLGIRLRFNSE